MPAPMTFASGGVSGGASDPDRETESAWSAGNCRRTANYRQAGNFVGPLRWLAFTGFHNHGCSHPRA